MSRINARRMHVQHHGTIEAPVDEVFPLACPYAEYEWISGWDCEIIYSESGRNENGCIFTEKLSLPFLHDADGGSTMWMTVLYDPTNHRVHFVLTTDISAIKYEIEMDASGNRATDIRLDLTLTALNERGNRFVENGGEEKVSMMLAGLGQMLKHYCETGEMLTRS